MKIQHRLRRARQGFDEEEEEDEEDEVLFLCVLNQLRTK